MHIFNLGQWILVLFLSLMAVTNVYGTMWAFIRIAPFDDDNDNMLVIFFGLLVTVCLVRFILSTFVFEARWLLLLAFGLAGEWCHTFPQLLRALSKMNKLQQAAQ